jgi:hypothetical protein
MTIRVGENRRQRLIGLFVATAIGVAGIAIIPTSDVYALTNGYIYTEVGGSGSSGPINTSVQPTGVAATSGRFFFSNRSHSLIRKVTFGTPNTLSTFAGNGTQ